MTKRTFESGDGLDHPNDGAMVDVEFKGKYSGNKEFDNRSIKFNIGDGLDVVSNEKICICRIILHITYLAFLSLTGYPRGPGDRNLPDEEGGKSRAHGRPQVRVRKGRSQIEGGISN